MTEPAKDESQPAVAPAAAAGGRFGASIRKSGYLRKWLLLGITISVIAGLGAVFFFPLEFAHGHSIDGYPSAHLENTGRSERVDLLHR